MDITKNYKEIEIDKQKLYECLLCGKITINKYQMLNHLLTHSKEQKQEIKETETQEEDKDIL
jgi:hypothetical protein